MVSFLNHKASILSERGLRCGAVYHPLLYCHYVAIMLSLCCQYVVIMLSLCCHYVVNMLSLCWLLFQTVSTSGSICSQGRSHPSPLDTGTFYMYFHPSCLWQGQVSFLYSSCLFQNFFFFTVKQQTSSSWLGSKLPEVPPQFAYIGGGNPIQVTRWEIQFNFGYLLTLRRLPCKNLLSYGYCLKEHRPKNQVAFKLFWTWV